MPILFDDEKIYSLYLEGKLSNLAKVGAMASASLMGNPNTTMADTTYNTTYSSENMRVLNNETIVSLWGKYYQGRNDPVKIQRAREVIANGATTPKDAMDAINTAIYIFGGDEGVSPNVLQDLLIYTGKIESDYRHKVQLGGGPARGYWQVEPFTAVDLLINSRAYFGPKFQRKFGNDLLRKVKQNDKPTRDYVGERILNDNELAAAFAAAKWISVSKRAGLKDIKN